MRLVHGSSDAYSDHSIVGQKGSLCASKEAEEAQDEGGQPDQDGDDGRDAHCLRV